MNISRGNRDFEVNIDKLDSSQAEAVKSDARNVLIRASAGSGKTTTLITAVAAYRYENLNDRICAITFTRAARAEMEARLQTLGIYDVEVTTIHVWARNLLEHFGKKYDFKVRILEEKDIKTILEAIVKEYLKHSKVKSVNLGILYTYITGSKKMDITDNYRRTLNALEERYIAYKRKNVLYDFTDYPLYLLDVLKTYKENINNIDALFVDEFQDVDTTQFEIFQLVNAAKKFFIGDSWQSIYIFRNADGEVFNKLSDFELHKLKYNYRSYQEIIDYATTVYAALREMVEDGGDNYITQVMHAQPSRIECTKGYGGYVYTTNPYGDTIEYHNGELNSVNLDDVFAYFMTKKPMVLCRTNKQVRIVQEKGYLNVNTIHQAKGLEYDYVIVIDNPMSSGIEDLNVAYVAMTRAKNELMVINWVQFEGMLDRSL